MTNTTRPLGCFILAATPGLNVASAGTDTRRGCCRPGDSEFDEDRTERDQAGNTCGDEDAKHMHDVARKYAVAAAVALLVVSLPVSANAAPLRLRLGWDDMQAVVSHAEISPRVVIWTGESGRKRVKGHLAGITEAGVTLRKPGSDPSRKPRCFVPRQEVHTIRLMPREGERFPGHPYRWRIGAVAVAVPAWYYGYIAGVLLPSGYFPEGRLFKLRNRWQGFALATALPYLIYRLAWKADRALGAILIELDRGT